MLKGQSDIISAVIIIIIAVGLVATAYTWGLPLIQKQQDTALVGRVANYFGNDNVNSLQKKIVSVAINGGEDTFSEDVAGLWTLIPNGTANYLVNPNGQTGLIAYWKFDEGTGTTATDSTGNGFTGTLTNSSSACANPPTSTGPDFCPSWTTGNFGGAINFDGTDDYVDVGSQAIFDVAPGQAKSFSLWFKAGQQSATGELIWEQGGCIGTDIALRNDGRIQFTFVTGDNGCTGDVTYQVISPTGTRYDDNNWHFVIGTIDRPNLLMNLYIDGQSEGTTAPDNTHSGTGGSLRIGTNWNNGAPFKGTIDEVQIWNRALSPSEISLLYANGPNAVVLNNNYLSFSFFSRVSNIATGQWVSLNGVSCYTSSGNIGEDPYSLCARADPFSNGYNIMYRLQFRPLFSGTQGYEIYLLQNPSGTLSSTAKILRIQKGNSYTIAVNGQNLIITEVKILLG